MSKNYFEDGAVTVIDIFVFMVSSLEALKKPYLFL